MYRRIYNNLSNSKRSQDSKMDFCDNCGILLPSPAGGDAVPYCKPCKHMKEEELKVRENSAAREQCLAQVNSYSDSDFSRNNEISAKLPSFRTDKKCAGKSNNGQHNSPRTKGDLNQTDNDFVTVQSSKAKGKRQSKNDMNAQCYSASGDTDVSPERDELAVKQISPEKEEIRQQWCRQQEEYKKQLAKDDTPTITALVSGHRRKNDGSRFYIGGVDISFIKGNEIDACACLTIVQMPDLQVVYQRMEMIKLMQPYIPGFLAFREVPPLEQLYNQMLTVAPQFKPDVIMVDGNGVLHPRGFGLACQLGVVLDVPTMGVAKTLMSAQGLVDDDRHKEKKKTLKEAGDGFELVPDTGSVLGLCLRVHDKAPNPVYISVGHNITLESARWITLECSKYRIPEPVRRADLDSREYLRQGQTKPTEIIKEE